MTITSTIQNEIIYQTKLHWISYLKPIFFIIIGFPFFFSLFFIKGFLYVALCTLIGFLFIKGIYKYFYLKSVKVILHKNYLSLSRGILGKRVDDIALSKMEGIGVYQNILGKYLNYGTLIVTTGEVTQSYFIQKPMEFRKHLLETIN
ncbi:membrane protein [Capnocytophaga stomatis]|nr:membrane protein [Capnocytophaga stomatis]